MKLANLHSESQIVRKVRRRIDKLKQEILGAQVSKVKDIVVAFPVEVDRFRSAVCLCRENSHEVGRVEAGFAYGKDQISAYLLALLSNGTAIEAWCDRSHHDRIEICLDGNHVGKCQVTPFANILARRTSTTWEIFRQGDLFGTVRSGISAHGRSLVIECPDGSCLPMRLSLKSTPLGFLEALLRFISLSFLWGNRPQIGKEQLMIPPESPFPPESLEELFYFTIVLVFRILVFDFNFESSGA